MSNSRPVEETMAALMQLVKEGKFDHIGLSEVSAATIRRAAKVAPVATVEIEFSLWSTEEKTIGVIDTCNELGITIVAYSPLGRGMPSGKWETKEDVPKHMRNSYPRYSDENFEHNKAFVTQLQKIAKQKGATAAQVAIKWVLAQGE